MIKTSKTIIYKKKSLDNGDVSNQIKNTLGSKTVSALKSVKEKENLKNNLKKVKLNQNKLTTNLKKTPFTKTFSKLPNDFEENEELVSLLLKDPDKMTSEEKNYIKAFNEEEFLRFMKFLKNKKKEQMWKGNGYGSGHYIDNFICIHSTERFSHNEKQLTLKGFIKRNHNNEKAKQISMKMADKTQPNRDILESNNLKLIQEDLVSDQCCIEMEDIPQNIISHKEIMTELENFKKLITEVKTDITFKKLDGQKDLMLKDMEDKTSIMKKEMERFNNKNESQSEIDFLYSKFKESVQKSEESSLSKDRLLERIRNYMNDTNLSTEEFIKIIDKTSFSTNLVDLDDAKKSMVKLNIFNQEESELFFDNLKKFYPSKMAFDKFVNLIIIESDYKPIFSEVSSGDEEERLLKIKTEEEEDEKTIKLKEKMEADKKLDEEEDYRLQVLKDKHISSIDKIKIKKFTRQLQRIYRGHLVRRKFFIRKIRFMLLVKLIQRRAKKFVAQSFQQKNQNSYKIYYFLLKQSQLRQVKKDLMTSSKNFLINKDPSRNFAAYYIQSFWRKYNESKQKIILNGKSISKSLIKSKTCVVCKKSRVTKLCLKCIDNHYCDLCFTRYHSHGVKRNHEFSEIVYDNKQKDALKDKSVKKVFTTAKDEAEELIEQFRECEFNILEHIKMWDYDKKGIISHQILKEAFSFKFFNFGTNICDKILNLSYRFTIKNHNKRETDEVLINYVEMCKSMFNSK